MTLRLLRALLAAVLPCLVLPLGAAEAAPAPAPAPADANARGFEQLNACLASGERVDALYVVDVSGSLVANDPDGRRFDALEASVAQLGVLTSAATGIRVDAAVATFGDSFSGVRSVQDWTPVDADSAGKVAARFRARAESAWAAAGTAQGTNYDAALRGAKKTLEARGARSSACQVVLWFTDGLFALGDSYDAGATNAASRKMCRPGGVVDQLRSAGTSVVALALNGPDVEAQLAQPSYAARRGELQAMAVGAAGDKTCGTTPVPAESRAGIYLSADDPVGLGALFSGVAAQAAGCVPETLQTPAPARFVVEPGVGRFQVDTSADQVARSVTVTAPDGTSGSFGPGTGELGSSQVEVLRSGSLLTVGVTLGASGQAGPWSVDAGDAAASVTLYRCADLTIEVPDPAEQLAGGESAVVEARVLDAQGRPADLTSYEAAGSPTIVTAPQAEAQVTVTDPATGLLSIALTPPDDVTSLTVAVGLTPRLTAAPTVPLGPVTTTRDLPVTPPGSFPTVSSPDLDLGRVLGLTPATAALRLTGSADGASRACFGDATDIDVPAASGRTRIAVTADCVDLAAGETTEVEVSMTPETSVDGEGRATLPVTLLNADGEEVQQDVALSWQLERQVDQGQRLWIVIVAVLGTLLLLWLSFVVVNRFLARFLVGDVRFMTLPVTVDAEGHVLPTRAVTEERPVDHYVTGADRRGFDDPSGSGTRFQARASRTAGDAKFTAHAPTGSRLVPQDGHVRGDGTSVRVDAGLGLGWLLQVADSDLLTDADRAVPARLTIYGRGEREQLLKALQRCDATVAENGWTQVHARLADQVRSSSSPSSATTAHDVRPTDVASSRELDDDPFGASAPASEPAAPAASSASPPFARRRTLRRSSRNPASHETTFGGSSADLADDDPFA